MGLLIKSYLKQNCDLNILNPVIVHCGARKQMNTDLTFEGDSAWVSVWTDIRVNVWKGSKLDDNFASTTTEIPNQSAKIVDSTRTYVSTLDFLGKSVRKVVNNNNNKIYTCFEATTLPTKQLLLIKGNLF